MFIDLTFMVATPPAQVQSHSTSATSAIPEDTTIKGIFVAVGAQMRVLVAATKSDTDTVNLEIPKSQVYMMSKKGYNLVGQGGNSYSMNALMLSGHPSLGLGISNPTVNGDTNAPYLLQ